MNLPFSAEQFIGVFEHYNLAIWPMQIIMYVLACIAVFMLLANSTFTSKIIAGILAFFWFWMGAKYHLEFFSVINPIAKVFAVFFLIQGLLYLYFGLFKQNLLFHFEFNVYTIVGFLFVLYGTIVYPLIGNALGHGYPKAPMFGVAPCPTTIFAFGLFLFTAKLPKSLLVIPLIWSLIGFTAAFKLGVPEDYGLLVAGLGGTLMVCLRDRQLTTNTNIQNEV